MIDSFVQRMEAGDAVALDQLLNAVYLLSGDVAPNSTQRQALQDLLLRELSRA